MKALNLYAGIGGNRALWDNVEVTAVEFDLKTAGVYADLYPQDDVVVWDAHDFLLKFHRDFDFIWSSPPCQTHSKARKNKARGTDREQYPDMKLYEEIIFLQKHARAKWVVENVKPYYKPLIRGRRIHRHLFWANFDVPFIRIDEGQMVRSTIENMQMDKGLNLSSYRMDNKRQALRNAVNPRLGLHVLRSATLHYRLWPDHWWEA